MKVSGGYVCVDLVELRPSANYQAQHLAALAQLPQLQLLETPLPVHATVDGRSKCKSGLTECTAILYLVGILCFFVADAWFGH